MRRDTRIKRDHVSAVSNWTPVGGAYGDKKTIRQCLALEVEFMQTTVPRWCQLAPQIQNEIFSEGFIDDEDILSYETCYCITLCPNYMLTQRRDTQ